MTWVAAIDLHLGEVLRTPDGGLVPVVGTRVFHRVQRVFNLTVEGLHTYYVEAGTTPVLVHNADDCFGDKWTSQSNLDQHFGDHGSEMGFKSQAEYRYAAEDLMCTCGGRRPGVLIKQDGKTKYYLDPRTGEFGVASDRGIVTYFKPDDPMSYFNKQPGVLIPK
ncbi:polymorphic toxin-type HINT domain-containing protein [Frankia sp. Cr2]|uniref:polymorphic toxin-type HINT domain-containing protein n=1 Tax=Frankia sp. Cr2 TaxID=3073932 RepID=UPI002AD33C7D|nr:polymorphic toxin-type HINT domain-containing protein [Frankia sp. Cr2]